MLLEEAQDLVLAACRILTIAGAGILFVAGVLCGFGAGRRVCRAKVLYFILGSRGKHPGRLYPVVELDGIPCPVREGRFAWRVREGEMLQVTLRHNGYHAVRPYDATRRLTRSVLLIFGALAAGYCAWTLFVS